MVDFELIIKYFSGRARPEEAEQAEDFARSSPERQAYFQSLYQSWLAAGDDIYEQPDIQKEWERFYATGQTGNTKKIAWRIPAIAASIAIILGLAGYYLWFNPYQRMIVIKASQAMNLSLTDQTQVTLEPGAELRYPKTFEGAERVVTLKGNAGFSVRHNPQQPFIVRLSHDLNIRVTGTEFSVEETAPDKVSVDLKKGSVLFYNKADTLPVAAGQTGLYLLTENKFVLVADTPKTGSFQFDGQPLSEVAAQLGHYFGVRFHFQNPGIAHCRFSGGMNNKNIRQLVGIIAVTFNLDYKIEGKDIYLEGEGCP
ncbi:MAG TPA: FecR domain-containing protein [Edaphocola sp.]|nr:FecR domain-containing protein [Edaphocola sp.]